MSDFKSLIADIHLLWLQVVLVLKYIHLIHLTVDFIDLLYLDKRIFSVVWFIAYLQYIYGIECTSKGQGLFMYVMGLVVCACLDLAFTGSSSQFTSVAFARIARISHL